ncbi:MAG TPA: GrpB family protein [Verrucomicrobiae bacterium]|nr:GrpB family protein [Verrucomicrobiae bacterium]
MSDVTREEQQFGYVVGAYTLVAAEYLPYNPESARVAEWIGKIITAAASDLQVEHIGSTAVPGCWGKGIIDLLVLYRAGELYSARAALDRLGFQRQPGSDPFPESRPMRVGDVEYFGRIYPMHAHVIAAGNVEAGDLLKFREILRGNTGLRRAYEAEKRAILARGVTRTTEYSKAKGDFIRAVLAAAEL